MKLTKFFTIVLCTGVLALTLSGCFGGTVQQVDTAATQSRQFMSNLNAAVQDMNTRLIEFNDAVSRGDLVTMRSSAENAFEVISTIESLEVPEQLAAVKNGYLEACGKLREALNSYLDLYTELSAAGGTMDSVVYQERLDEIQNLYNQAISMIQETDTKATQQ